MTTIQSWIDSVLKKTLPDKFVKTIAQFKIIFTPQTAKNPIGRCKAMSVNLEIDGDLVVFLRAKRRVSRKLNRMNLVKIKFVSI